MYHNLISLVPTRTDFRIRIRVTRSWPFIGHSDNVMLQNLVVLDTENYHMHAYVRQQKWAEIQNIVHEGNMYIVEKFQVTEARDGLRPVSSPFCIMFLNDTVITPIVRYFPAIPRHKFEFVPFHDVHVLTDLVDDEPFQKYALDINGVVKDLEPISEIQTIWGPRNIGRFCLYDGSISVKVAVWHELTSVLNPLYEGNEPRPVVILAGVKARRYKDMIMISTLPQTKIYINLPIDDVAIMRQRIMDVENDIVVDGP